MAASNARIVSSGRSHLLRVGLDLSGSAWMRVNLEIFVEGKFEHTNRISICVSVLNRSKGSRRRYSSTCNHRCKIVNKIAVVSNQQDSQGSNSDIANRGSAFVLSLCDSFSACVSTRWIFPPLPLLRCVFSLRRLKELFERGRLSGRWSCCPYPCG